jgi:hypothetical protein
MSSPLSHDPADPAPDDLAAIGLDPRERARASVRDARRLYALALVLMVLGVVVRWLRGRAEAAPRYDWLVLYVMPYDNDLDRCAQPIRAALERGLRAGEGSDRVAVAILEDRVDRGGLRESLVTRGQTERWSIASEDSADPAQVLGFVERMRRRAPARRHVIVLLDHGGSVDDIGLDERPSRTLTATGGRWLSAERVGEGLRRWRARDKTDVPVLFLQQCGRGAIETLYALRGAADTIVASQTYVGSCNTYYEPFVQRLRRSAALTPREVAWSIMDNDQDYTTYSLYDGRALEEWPARATALARALAVNATQEINSIDESQRVHALREVNQSFISSDEEYLDLVDVARRLAATRGQEAQREAERMERWVRTRLVMDQRQRGNAFRPNGWRSWSGVSTAVPFEPSMSAAARLPGWAFGEWISVSRMARRAR